MPTALERTGDFSQSYNTTGQLILIRDPLSGLPCNNSSAAGCFPGNKIPANRFSPIGQAMLHLFPLPNTVDPTRRAGGPAQIPATPAQRPQRRVSPRPAQGHPVTTGHRPSTPV